MTIEELEMLMGSNGKAILEMLRGIANSNPRLIKLKDMPMGLQVWVIAQDSEIMIVQIWGASGNESANSLETRMQWITGRVFLNNTERLKVTSLFQRAQFKPIEGSYGNFRLEFDEARTKISFDAVEMAKLKGAIIDTAKLVVSLKK
jgi:hypothetical protein